MELLIALLLTWLDQAGRVISGCCVKGGLPNYYSSRGLADVTAFYDDADSEPAFHVVGEVSVRRKVTPTYYRTQLTQTYKHALEQSRKHDGIPVYGLVINSGKITRSTILQDCVPPVPVAASLGGVQQYQGIADVHAGFHECHVATLKSQYLRVRQRDAVKGIRYAARPVKSGDHAAEAGLDDQGLDKDCECGVYAGTGLGGGTGGKT